MVPPVSGSGQGNGGGTGLEDVPVVGSCRHRVKLNPLSPGDFTQHGVSLPGGRKAAALGQLAGMSGVVRASLAGLTAAAIKHIFS